MKKSFIIIAIFVFMILCNHRSDTKNNMPNPFLDTVSYPITSIKQSIREKYPVVQALSDDQLQVRQSQDLCPRELTFLQNRMPKVTQALKESFDVDAPLKIGLCFSGGGNRAMLVSLGFLLGAQDIGLYDAAYYMVGLSGSTWTISPFSYLSAMQGMTLTQFKDQLIPRLGSVMKVISATVPPVPVFSKYQNSSMQNNFIKRYGYDQYLSSIDMYAAFVGDFTLLPAGKKRLDVTWSSIADTIELGNIPMPLCSAVAYKKTHKEGTQYYWLEIGPFEVGSDQLKSYVPTQAFGSQFKKGKPVAGYLGHAPEYPISFYEAVCGSAFTFSINEILDRNVAYSFTMLGQNVTLPLKQMMHSNITEKLRFSPATFHNYTFGLQNSPIEKDTTIRLYDGAMNFNFPLPVAMRPARDLDLIVIGDASLDSESFKFAQNHFKRNKIKFPDMTNLTDKMIAKPITIFNDPRLANYDKDMVTIAYCPFIKNEGFSQTFDPTLCQEEGPCRTFNFNYTKIQAEEVVGLARYNVNFVKDEITSVVQALQNKQKVMNKIVAAPVLSGNA